MKELSVILTVPDQLPVDFYTNPEYDKQLDQAIENTTNLVYTLDEEGEKAAKTDATAINKFATLYDKYIAATYKAQTETVTKWRDGKKSKTKLLLENRQKLIDQFAEKRAEKLYLIWAMLEDYVKQCREELNVKHEFYAGVDLEPMVKLTGTLTDSGALTKKAKDFCRSIANSDLAEQNRIEARHLLIENKCLRADINPPLSQVHFGSVFYADDDEFNAKLDELIAVEIELRAEMEARIVKQQEAKKQQEIEAALKAQQAESDRIAQEKVEEPVERKVEITHQQVENVIAQKRKEEFDRKHPDVLPDKRTVLVTVVFKFDGIGHRVSNQGVIDFCKTQLSEKLSAIVTNIEADNA